MANFKTEITRPMPLFRSSYLELFLKVAVLKTPENFQKVNLFIKAIDTFNMQLFFLFYLGFLS